MGVSAEGVVVTICGVEYSIKADVSVETTQQIAAYVDSQMSTLKQVPSVRSEMAVAVLSALNIAGELHEYREKFEEAQKSLEEIKERTTALSQKINGTIV